MRFTPLVTWQHPTAAFKLFWEGSVPSQNNLHGYSILITAGFHGEVDILPPNSKPTYTWHDQIVLDIPDWQLCQLVEWFESPEVGDILDSWDEKIDEEDKSSRFETADKLKMTMMH
jgi:hypothetical protein